MQCPTHSIFASFLSNWIQGDTQVRLFEVTSEKPFVHYLTTHQGTTPYRGACVMPKRECKYMECEVMRFFFLMSKGWVEPVSMTVPRKVNHSPLPSSCSCMLSHFLSLTVPSMDSLTAEVIIVIRAVNRLDFQPQ